MAETDLAPDARIPRSDEIHSLTEAVEHLQQATRYLRNYGFVASLTTAINVITAVSVPAEGFLLPSVRALLACSAVFAISAVVAVVRFEYWRKFGGVLFDEIADELQWDVRSQYANEEAVERKPPSLQFRIALREFARSTDVPLVPGKFGPMVYAIVNVAVFFAAAAISRLALFS